MSADLLNWATVFNKTVPCNYVMIADIEPTILVNVQITNPLSANIHTFWSGAAVYEDSLYVTHYQRNLPPPPLPDASEA
jgi:hypothetical protein